MEDQNQLDSFFKITFDDKSRESLQSITMWAKIVSICAFVGYGLGIVIAFFGGVKTISYSEQSESISTFSRAGAIAGALITAIIGVAINYFLYRFAVTAKQGLTNVDQLQLNDGFRNLKTYFKILGIILLICLIFVGLAVLIAMFASLGRR